MEFETQDPFDPMPRRAPCPVCFTNNWVTRTRGFVLPEDEKRGLPSVVLRQWEEVICGTCHRIPETYKPGVEPNQGHEPLNF